MEADVCLHDFDADGTHSRDPISRLLWTFSSSRQDSEVANPRALFCKAGYESLSTAKKGLLAPYQLWYLGVKSHTPQAQHVHLRHIIWITKRPG